jgi:FlaA1/EpsC-like NDP-sugar epimerase
VTSNNGHSRASSTNKSALPSEAASPNEVALPNEAASPNNAVSPNEVILITGAGGSIGSSIARHFRVRAQHRCAPACHDVSGTSVLFNDRAPNPDRRTIVLLDHSEQNLYEINSELSAPANPAQEIIPILGDVNDASLLEDLFEKYRPTQVFHAAAFKHVPLTEQNPIAVIRNNILGTKTLAGAAIKHGARQLLLISTDKAANPRSIMGAAKRVAEQILTRLDTPATRMRSIRLGNVLGSTGSVVPLFERQIQSGGPVTVTHPEATRYFLSLQEATDFILAAASLNDPATLFVPDLPAPIKILDLAQKLIAEAHPSPASDKNSIEILFTGLRPGDKLHEDLLSSSESAEPTAHPKLRRIHGPLPTAKSLDSAISVISEKLQSRDLPALLDAIRSLVPGYHPSDLISANISTQLSATVKA